MTSLADYQNRFSTVRFERHDGILEMAIHKDGGPAQWGFGKGSIHDQLGEAFYAVGRDPENKIVILTGTGDVFLQDYDYADMAAPPKVDPFFWDRIYKEGKDLLQNLLEIEVPVIGAVNGNAYIHAELLMLSDIVISADSARLADKAHTLNGTVPSDGVHIVWPMLLGPNRGRYFLLMGQEIDAQEALRLGVVGEVVPAAELRDRAWAIARELVTKPQLMLRYARVAMTQDLKRRMVNDLGYGLALEGLAAISAVQQ
jgi:enoyl-CoA hydratase/carnithine racemase